MEELCTCMSVSPDKMHKLLRSGSYVCNLSFNLPGLLAHSNLVNAEWGDHQPQIVGRGKLIGIMCRDIL